MKNFKIKNCFNCEAEFIPKSGIQKFCSKECFEKVEKEYQKKYFKNWIKTHKKDKAILDREYYKEHEIKIKKYQIRYHVIHKEEIAKIKKVYWQIYSKKHKRERIEYLRNKRKTDIAYKIRCYLSSRIWKALKGINKNSSTSKLLGCSIEQLKLHLESQFTVGMTWNNYGKWHVDHIRPCASFDLSKSEEQTKCFNWKNLQPLWAEENLRKNKY